MNILKQFLLLSIFYISAFSSENIQLSFKNKNQEILSKSDIFLDVTNSLDIEDIKLKKFKSNGKKSLSYGYSPDFTVWVRFTLQNSTNKTISKVLEYANPITTNIEFYDGKDIYKDGLFQLNLSKESINPIFDILLKPNETKTYYLKAKSQITTLIIKLNLKDKALYQKESYHHQMILAMFFGVMAILALYNLFIYFFTKDINYLFYLLYMVGVIIHQLFYTGFGNIYLFSQELSKGGVLFAEFYVAFTIFMFALLVRSFLNLKQYKSVYKFYNSYLLLFPFLVIVVWYFEIFSIRNFFSFLLLIITSFILLFAIYKRNRQAYFVGFGWLMFALSVGFMYLSSVGILDIFDNFRYFVEVGLILEAVIFSIALADKIKQLEDQKNIATMQLVLKEQTEKQKLERTVEQKTKDLKKALDEKSLLLKEINHRVKNNMQLIQSLIRLQSDEIEDIKIKEIFTTIQNRISAMSSLHQLLYTKDDISFIDTYGYFQQLIDELRSTYETKNIKINFDIKTDIKVDDAVYCGLILNELVTNSLKYAFLDHEGVIDISLKKQFDYYFLVISDDGVGYDLNSTKGNLGITLIDTLVNQQLKGTIQKDTNDGVKVIIKW